MASRDLIVFGEDWGGLPSSTQHLIKYLAENRKVLWVNSIGLRRPRLTFRDMQRAIKKVFSCLKKKPISPQSDTSGITVIKPISIPAPRSAVGKRIAALLLERQIRPVAAKLGIEQPILWASLPTAVDVVGSLGESHVVYYCCDDFSSLEGVDHDVVSKAEKALVEKAQLVITSSHKLSAKFAGSHPKELAHGVDYRLFSQATPRAVDLPQRGRPIAGFYGSISSWLDMALMEKVIFRLPHWDFVFIGEQQTSVDKIKQYENVFFLDAKPHHDLPKYSQHWDAAILPFKINPQINACNPLKLREYLATGKPVVTRKFPAIEPFKHAVQCADSAEDFAHALELSRHLSETPQHGQFLQKLVKTSSWDNKSRQLERWLDAL